jgi:hypothetical protein
MAALGRTTLTGVGMGNPIRVSFDGLPRWKAGGVTIDWSTVAAVSGSDVTTKEGFVVPIGSKYLRYGQPLLKITTAHAQTVTVSGTPTGGTFSYVITDPTTGNVATVSALAYNANVATHQAALDAAIGSNKVTVSGAGALTANVHTITASGLNRYVIYPLITLAANALTGGTSPTVAFAVSAGATAGEFGPFDPDATDGRQTLVQGRVFILDETLLEESQFGSALPSPTPEVVGAIEGGRVWRSRVLANESSGTLVAGPTWANLIAAMPEIQPVEN